MPRHLVHRAAVAEVLLTGWHAGPGPADLHVDAQWPRSHAYYASVDGRWHDPMLMAETARQASMLAAFTTYGAPSDGLFLMHELSFVASPDALAHDDSPANLDVLVAGLDVARRGDSLRSMTTSLGIYRYGRSVGAARSRFTCLTSAAYRRLRGDVDPRHAGRPDMLPAGQVGRERAIDVVLGHHPDPHTWRLWVDPRHPTLYDHAVDHVPGMGLLEASRQVAHAVTGTPRLVLTELAVVFHRYVEIASECLVTAEHERVAGTGEECLSVTFVQNGQTMAEARVLVRRIGGH